MSSISCGVDIENKDRLKKLFKMGLIPPDIFNKTEWKDIQSENSLLYLYFTFKEAFLKALGYGWFNGPIRSNEITLRKKQNKISLTLSGMSRELFLTNGYSFININHMEYNKNVITEVIIGKNNCRNIKYKRTIIDINKIKNKYIANMDSQDQSENNNWRKNRMASHMAGRIAAKHSLVKLIKEFDNTFHFIDVEIRNDAFGKPFICGSENKNFPFFPVFSISHSKQYAICLSAIYLG